MFREIVLIVWAVLCSVVPRVFCDCSKSVGVKGFDDVGSRTVMASVVFEGTVVEVVRIPDPVGAGQQKFTAVKLIVEKTLKGHLPSDEPLKDHLRSILLRTESGCVENLKRKHRYIVFLSSSWITVGPDTVYSASGSPEKYSKKGAKEVQKHLHRNCGGASRDPCVTSVRLNPARNLSVDVGADVTIRCVVTGRLRSQVTWFRNDRPMPEVESAKRKNSRMESKLVIKSAKPEDGAKYWCQATNVLGSTNSSVLTLTVTEVEGSTGASSQFQPCPNPDYCFKGECDILPGSIKPRCTCPPGYTGQRCQDRQHDEFDFSKIDAQTSNLETILTFGTFLFMVLVFVVFVSILCCVAKLRSELKDRFYCVSGSEIPDTKSYDKLSLDQTASNDNQFFTGLSRFHGQTLKGDKTTHR